MVCTSPVLSQPPEWNIGQAQLPPGVVGRLSSRHFLMTSSGTVFSPVKEGPEVLGGQPVCARFAHQQRHGTRCTKT